MPRKQSHGGQHAPPGQPQDRLAGPQALGGRLLRDHGEQRQAEQQEQRPRQREQRPQRMRRTAARVEVHRQPAQRQRECHPRVAQPHPQPADRPQPPPGRQHGHQAVVEGQRGVEAEVGHPEQPQDQPGGVGEADRHAARAADQRQGQQVALRAPGAVGYFARERQHQAARQQREPHGQEGPLLRAGVLLHVQRDGVGEHERGVDRVREVVERPAHGPPPANALRGGFRAGLPWRQAPMWVWRP